MSIDLSDIRTKADEVSEALDKCVEENLRDIHTRDATATEEDVLDNPGSGWYGVIDAMDVLHIARALPALIEVVEAAHEAIDWLDSYDDGPGGSTVKARLSTALAKFKVAA